MDNHYRTSLGLIFEHIEPRYWGAVAATCRVWHQVIAARQPPLDGLARWCRCWIGRHADVPSLEILRLSVAVGGCGMVTFTANHTQCKVCRADSALSCAVHAAEVIDVPEMLRRWLGSDSTRQEYHDSLEEILERLIYLSLWYPGLARRMLETIICVMGELSPLLVSKIMCWIPRDIDTELEELREHRRLPLMRALCYINGDELTWGRVLSIISIYSGEPQWEGESPRTYSAVDRDALEVILILSTALMIPDVGCAVLYVDAQLRGPASQRYVDARLCGECSCEDNCKFDTDDYL